MYISYAFACSFDSVPKTDRFCGERRKERITTRDESICVNLDENETKTRASERDKRQTVHEQRTFC